MSRPAPREVYWLPIEGVLKTKGRPCVVTLVEGEWVEVVYGQTKEGSGPGILIGPEDPNFKRWRLDHPTYFRRGNVKMIKRSDVEKATRAGFCTKDRFPDFEEIAEEWRRNAPR